MAHRTPTSPVASTTNPANDAAARQLLAGVPLYADATPEQQAALERDMAALLADGMTAEDYLSALAAWDGDAAGYLAQCPDAGDDDGQDSTPAEEDAPAPTSTLAQANATLARFGTACRDAAEANYQLAALAWQYVQEFLGAAPGRAQRGTAVETLADEWRKWDEDSMAVPLASALKRLRERVNLLLRCHAVATLLGDGRGVAKGNATRRGRGKGSKDSRLPWGTLRELCPLVYRVGGDAEQHAERWAVLPSVAEQARGLVVEVAASGMARADVVAAVAKLMLADATLELTAARDSGDKARVQAAEQAVERWGGKVERTAPKPAGNSADKPAGNPATPPAAPTAGATGATGATAATPSAPTTPAATPTPSRDAAPIGPAECRADNLLRGVVAATPKDAAGVLADAITHHPDCDDVLLELLRMLDGHPDLHATSKAAVAEALAVLDDADEDDDADATRKAARAALASLKGPLTDDDADAA